MQNAASSGEWRSDAPAYEPERHASPAETFVTVNMTCKTPGSVTVEFHTTTTERVRLLGAGLFVFWGVFVF